MTACSGGSSSDDSTETSPTVVSLDELIDRGATFEDLFGTINVDSDELADAVTPAEDIPTSGSATYTGIVFMGDMEFVAIGSTTMTANFTDSSISGSSDNFFLTDDPNIADLADVTGERIDGSLTYELDRADDDSNLFTGQFVGAFTPTGEEEIVIDVPGGGGFLGENLEGFATEGFDDDGNFAGILVTKD